VRSFLFQAIKIINSVEEYSQTNFEQTAEVVTLVIGKLFEKFDLKRLEVFEVDEIGFDRVSAPLISKDVD